MCFRVRKQLAEAMGAVNRWYCSQAFGRRVDDPETLVIYFIRKGGAADFAARYDAAMSPANRWYCSEHHGREVSEPEVLWNYYEAYRLAGPGSNPTRDTPFEDDSADEMSIAS